MTTLTLTDVNWPDINLPPINLWSAPRMKTTKTQWSCSGHTITCTRGHLSASVEAPILGSYTDARLWLSLLRYAITACEAKLFNLELRGRV